MKSDEEIEVKSFKDMSIYRDIFIWLFCLLILPLIIISSIFYTVKTPIENNFDSNNEKLTIETKNNSLMRKISLKKYHNSVCNDGSPASYYLRKTNSSNWVVVLEGGFFCYDIASCKQRYENSFNLTSSKVNREFKTGTGILSTSIDENKNFHNANLINIPYCSSDLWIGNSNGGVDDLTGFKFKGSQIIEDVLTDLLNNFEMKEARNVILSGISAGGLGLILNIDKINEKLEKNAPKAKVKAILDSSWFIDLPYSYLCNNNLNDENCLIRKILTDSIKYWNASSECKKENIIDCFLPDKLIQSIKIPLLIVQTLFDETQLLEQFKKLNINNNEISSLKTFKDTVRQLNKRLTHSITTKTRNFFVPACVQHMILTRIDWNKFRIGNTHLDDAIYCWSINECDIRLIEKCKYPNCNSSCPKMNHPDFDKSISLIDYFSYFGMINYEEIGTKLKLNYSQLKKMSYKKIMQLLFI